MTKKEKEIKESLIQQLRDKGAEMPLFLELVETYMELYAIEKKLRKDVRTNGIRITKYDKNGNEYEEDNTSVQKAGQLLTRRIALLRQMGLSTNTCASDEDDEL